MRNISQSSYEDRPMWFALSDGHKTGTSPVRRVSYTPYESTARVDIRLFYKLPGFWLTRVQDSEEQYMIQIPGGRMYGVPGVPMLPTDIFSLALPFGATFDPLNIKVLVQAQQELDEFLRLAPFPEPYVESQSADTEEDPQIYGRDDWVPSDIANLQKPSEIDGLCRTIVRLHPIAYAPQSRRLLARTRIRIRFICKIWENGHYDSDSVDWLSPVLSSVLGSKKVLAGI